MEKERILENTIINCVNTTETKITDEISQRF
jgi:hypothetical protein